MTAAPFRIDGLDDSHDRAAFRCGEEPLDSYFRTQATQDIRRRIAYCFVAVESVTAEIAAYYTLSATSIALIDLPADLAKRLPRYPSLPAVRIGRLAVDIRFQGRGLGSVLLMDAVAKTMRADAAAFSFLVDAKNDRAVEFYCHLGFRSLASAPRTLFLPLSTAQQAFKA